MAIIRTKRDTPNAAGEYESFIPVDYWRAAPMRKGQVVAGLLDVLEYPKGKVWRIKEHRMLLCYFESYYLN